MHLGLVTLVVPDYNPALLFFCDGLGFERVEDKDEGHKRWVVIRPPGSETALLLARAASPDQRASIGRQVGDRVGFFLYVEEFAPAYAQLEAAGATFLETPRDEAYGRVVKWQDPFGNRWDLICPAG